MPDLADDDRLTLWGLFLEAFHGLEDGLLADLDGVFSYPPAFFEVLLRVARTPGHAVPMTQLANMVLFSSGGFTKLADRMEAAGLIERVPCPTDRRKLLATITPEGERVLEKALKVHVPSIDRRLVEPLTVEERAQLESILRKLRDPYCPTDEEVDPTDG
ncbi:MAG TPA: MarR family transcriptional regulator [Microthrixaceae bacterium]|nr:MarR family transcriptional regulator [Microthrixaceae bacterium]